MTCIRSSEITHKFLIGFYALCYWAFPWYHFQGKPFMVSCGGDPDSIPVKHPSVINGIWANSNMAGASWRFFSRVYCPKKSCQIWVSCHIQMSSINLQTPIIYPRVVFFSIRIVSIKTKCPLEIFSFDLFPLSPHPWTEILKDMKIWPKILPVLHKLQDWSYLWEPELHLSRLIECTISKEDLIQIKILWFTGKMV